MRLGQLCSVLCSRDCFVVIWNVIYCKQNDLCRTENWKNSRHWINSVNLWRTRRNAKPVLCDLFPQINLYIFERETTMSKKVSITMGIQIHNTPSKCKRVAHVRCEHRKMCMSRNLIDNSDLISKQMDHFFFAYINPSLFALFGACILQKMLVAINGQKICIDFVIAWN